MTTSTGIIVEFDRGGLRKNFDKGIKSPWAQSLLVDNVPDAWMEHWDEILLSVCMVFILLFSYIFLIKCTTSFVEN